MSTRLSGAALVIVTVFALAACSSGGSPTQTPAQANAAGASPQSASVTSSGTVKSINVCTVLPAALAAQLSGQPYTSGAHGGASDGWTSGCTYSNDVGVAAQEVNVNIDTSDNASSTWTAVHAGSMTEIAGVGDKAFWDNDNTLYAMSGSALIQINGLNSQGKSEALAKAIINALH